MGSHLLFTPLDSLNTIPFAHEELSIEGVKLSDSFFEQVLIRPPSPLAPSPFYLSPRLVFLPAVPPGLQYRLSLSHLLLAHVEQHFDRFTL